MTDDTMISMIHTNIIVHTVSLTTCAVTDVDETKVSQKQVMTHLVHLVCMNMSHLLKNQIDMQKQNERMGHLAAKMEQLLGPSPPSTQVENLYQHQERSYIESFLGGHGAEQTTAELEVSPVRADGYKKAVNGAIAELLTPPLTPSAGEAVAALSSSIIQSSLMNGSSPSDWLFQDNFSTPGIISYSRWSSRIRIH